MNINKNNNNNSCFSLFYLRLADKHVPQCDLSPPSLLHVHENVHSRSRVSGHSRAHKRTGCNHIPVWVCQPIHVPLHLVASPRPPLI